MTRPAQMSPMLLVSCLALGIAANGAHAAASEAAMSPQRLASAGSAGFETIDTTSLSGTMQAMPSGAVPPAAGLVMQARAQTLRPAPLPDPDLEAPGPGRQGLAAQEEASLQPNFYGRPKPFSGDGFAAGSTLDDGHAIRHRPGGGMSLSIPMP